MLLNEIALVVKTEIMEWTGFDRWLTVLTFGVETLPKNGYGKVCIFLAWKPPSATVGNGSMTPIGGSPQNSAQKLS